MAPEPATAPLTLTLTAQRAPDEPVWPARAMLGLTLLIGAGLLALLALGLGLLGAGLVILAALVLSGTIPVPVTLTVAAAVLGLGLWSRVRS